MAHIAICNGRGVDSRFNNPLWLDVFCGCRIDSDLSRTASLNGANVGAMSSFRSIFTLDQLTDHPIGQGWEIEENQVSLWKHSQTPQ